MSQPVFISYARADSAVQAQTLAAALNGQAFLDTESIDDGDDFPQRLLDALLASRIVVIFASKNYLERRFCRVEMRLALHAGNENTSHIVLASGDDAEAVRDAMPEQVARINWPLASETNHLAALVRKRLDRSLNPLSSRIPAQEARVVASLFIEEASIPEPRSLQGIPVSFPPGLAAQSIGRRFVGRAADLRHLHNLLSEGSGSAARLTGRISAGAGFGKTRLAIEYLNRYGPRHYAGGIFWINAESSVLDEEFWRVLHVIDSDTPDITLLRGQKPTIRERLDAALRAIEKPVLYIADNVPEAAPNEDPLPLETFCPALAAVTVIATSRQDTRESGVESIKIDELERDSAILLLRKDVSAPASLSWEDWDRIAEWIGNLPVALELLNRALALGSISPKQLLAFATGSTASATTRLDSFGKALRGQVSSKAAAGVTAAFSISYEKLLPSTQTVARILAQLAPTPIPNEFLDALPEELNVPGARAALRSRHFVIPSDAETFGIIHRLTADFLRSLPEEPEHGSFEAACKMVAEVMTFDRCKDPEFWPLMNLCRPHAETLFGRGQDNDATAVSACGMGLRTEIFASAKGDYSHARQIEERVLEIRKRVQQEDHRDILIAMNNLAQTMLNQGDYKAAEQMHRQELEICRRVQGEEHPDTLISKGNVALTLYAQGRFSEARQLQEEVLEASKRVHGEEHKAVLRPMNNLAETLAAQNELTQARKLHERTLEIRKRLLGEGDADTLVSMSNLAGILRRTGDVPSARKLQEYVLKVISEEMGATHPSTLTAMNNLAETLCDDDDLPAAQELHERTVELRRRVLGQEHPQTLTSMNNLALVLHQKGDSAAALRLLDDALAVQLRLEREDHPTTVLIKSNIQYIEDQSEKGTGANGQQGTN